MKTNISIQLLNHELPLVCDMQEKILLSKSAEFLNSHLKEFRKHNSSIEQEKAVLMGALKATCELINQIDTLSDQAKIANEEIQNTLMPDKS